MVMQMEKIIFYLKKNDLKLSNKKINQIFAKHISIFNIHQITLTSYQIVCDCVCVVFGMNSNVMHLNLINKL